MWFEIDPTLPSAPQELCAPLLSLQVRLKLQSSTRACTSLLCLVDRHGNTELKYQGTGKVKIQIETDT